VPELVQGREDQEPHLPLAWLGMFSTFTCFVPPVTDLADALQQTIHFLKTIKDPRVEDYDITYRYKNRFAFLGDGSVKATNTKDIYGLAPYVRGSDHEWSVD